MESEVGKRLEVERSQAVQERLSNAAELVAVVREQQALRVSLFELSALAPRQRERQAATPERAPEAEARSAAERLMEEVQARAQRLEAERIEAPTSSPAKSAGSLDLGVPGVEREAAERAGAQAQPEPPAAPAMTPKMSLAEQLELLSNEVAERLDREAHPQRGRGLEETVFRRQLGLDAAGRPRADHQPEPGGRRAGGPADAAGGGEVASQRLQPSDGSNELTLAERLHARADEVARRLEQEMAQDRAVRAQRAEVERQRVLKVTEEKQRGRGRSRGRALGDDDEFTRGHGR
jgi:hypothetical protein